MAPVLEHGAALVLVDEFGPFIPIAVRRKHTPVALADPSLDDRSLRLDGVGAIAVSIYDLPMAMVDNLMG